jgi:homoserine dehydrogenase
MPQATPAALNLVLIGFGHVARTLVHLLDDRRAHLQELGLPPVRIAGIATARHGCVLVPEGLEGSRAVSLVESGGSVAALGRAGDVPPRDARALLARAGSLVLEGPLVVLETTTLNVRDGEPATTHVKAALAAGAHVITANKGPIACAWSEIREAAARAHRQLLFEGVVMDGIPVFNLVRDTLPALTVVAVRGIVNTTTNYLLAALEEGRDMAPALAEMQARGIAEADASLDVDGWDAAAKAAALANVLMEARLTPADVKRTGVAHLTTTDARAALDAQCRLKLVMHVRREGGRVAASVAPERVAAGDVLAGVHGTMNALTISTDRLSDLTVIQHGGSLVETAYALVSDLVTLWRRLAPGTVSAR